MCHDTTPIGGVGFRQYFHRDIHSPIHLPPLLAATRFQVLWGNKLDRFVCCTGDWFRSSDTRLKLRHVQLTPDEAMDAFPAAAWLDCSSEGINVDAVPGAEVPGSHAWCRPPVELIVK